MSVNPIKLAHDVLEADKNAANGLIYLKEFSVIAYDSAALLASALLEAHKEINILHIRDRDAWTRHDAAIEGRDAARKELAETQKRIAQFEAQSDPCKTCDHPRSEHFGDDWACLEQVWDERRGSDSCRCEAFTEPDAEDHPN